ncbi:MAG: hypothetical protein LBB13_04160, partial [Rickettsiales bacterium]|nr:hypothetical protein [Rickettsiales bacterium]
MKISEKSKIYCQCVSLFLRSVLVASIVFSTVTMARAEPTEVNSFDELERAIGDNGKNYINVKQNIPFTNEIVINRSNLTISGPGEGEEVELNGDGKHRFFIIEGNSENISLKNLHLKSVSSGDESGYDSGGGAIHLGKEVVVNLEGLTFSGNQTKSQGGAIYSRGTDSDNKNSLNFTEKTIFDGNKTINKTNLSKGGAIFAVDSTLIFERGLAIFENNSSIDGGGAIYAEDSSLIFGKATFENNSSTRVGGAIYGGNGTKLTFGGEVIFRKNSSASDGGAIFSLGKNDTDKNILKFEGNATFVRNSTTEGGNGNGGAISVAYSSLTFGGLATFENNSSRDNGGAIYASDSSSIEFNNGLILIENTTEKADSGAIDMYGLEDRLAIITIVQKNLAVPTEFRGNTSGDDGHNAV